MFQTLANCSFTNWLTSIRVRLIARLSPLSRVQAHRALGVDRRLEKPNMTRFLKKHIALQAEWETFADDLCIYGVLCTNGRAARTALRRHFATASNRDLENMVRYTISTMDPSTVHRTFEEFMELARNHRANCKKNPNPEEY